MLLDFEWDPIKAKINLRKHGVSFDQAARVFLDPRALTLPDRDHSDEEDRWITLGSEGDRMILVVCHVYMETKSAPTRIRIFSARAATKRESARYREENP